LSFALDSIIKDDRIKQKELDPMEALEAYRKAFAKQLLELDEADLLAEVE
jgi:hypothetical protein